MAAFRAHETHDFHGFPGLSDGQTLWLKDVACGAALAVFLAVLAML